jgi:hypothetical protein
MLIETARLLFLCALFAAYGLNAGLLHEAALKPWGKGWDKQIIALALKHPEQINVPEESSKNTVFAAVLLAGFGRRTQAEEQWLYRILIGAGADPTLGKESAIAVASRLEKVNFFQTIFERVHPFAIRRAWFNHWTRLYKTDRNVRFFLTQASALALYSRIKFELMADRLMREDEEKTVSVEPSAEPTAPPSPALSSSSSSSSSSSPSIHSATAAAKPAMGAEPLESGKSPLSSRTAQ